MAIVGHSPDELFDKLYRQENFRGYAFSARDGDDSDEDQTQSSALALQSSTPQPSASIRRPRLQTRLPPDKLERRVLRPAVEDRSGDRRSTAGPDGVDALKEFSLVFRLERIGQGRKCRPPIALAARDKYGLALFVGESIERLLDG
jgi:hypothetical protein